MELRFPTERTVIRSSRKFARASYSNRARIRHCKFGRDKMAGNIRNNRRNNGPNSFCQFSNNEVPHKTGSAMSLINDRNARLRWTFTVSDGCRRKRF